MDEEVLDPLSYYEVPEAERVDEDPINFETVALEGGPDDNDLEDIFADPGPVVDLGGE